MKSSIAGMVLLMFITVTTTFAKNIGEDVNAKALKTFNHKFADAMEVSWLKTDNYYKASFKLNDQALTAFFSETGEWLGVSRNLLSSQLPINLQSQLKKNYSQYWISDLFEYASEGETYYYTTVENADQKLTLRSSGSGDWSVFKKGKKE